MDDASYVRKVERERCARIAEVVAGAWRGRASRCAPGLSKVDALTALNGHAATAEEIA